MMVIINQDASVRVGDFYHNAIKSHPNTFTREGANNSIKKLINSLNKLTLHEMSLYKKSLVENWREKGYKEYCVNKQWYIAYRIVNDDIIIEDVENYRNIADNAHHNEETLNVNPHNSNVPKTPLNSQKYKKVADAGFGFNIVKSKVGRFNFEKDGKLLSDKWFKNVKKFHDVKAGTIAFVNDNGQTKAVKTNGDIIDMNKGWDEMFTEKKILMFLEPVPLFEEFCSMI